MTTGFFATISEDKSKLPHPPFDIRQILKVEEAVRYAWNILKQDEDFDLYVANEDDITLNLQKNLENLRINKSLYGFNSDIFETVNRGSNLENYNGESINKQPDLIFRLCGNPHGIESYTWQNGIITECKPIDKNHTVGSKYCKQGIKRFVNGEYAWAMTHSMMIGYVTGDYTIDPKLSYPLEKHKNIYNTEKQPYICAATKSLQPPVYVTVHKRDWKYPQTSNRAKEIEIRHLWLIISKK